MMYILKVAASFLALFTARSVSSEYKKFRDNKNAVLEGFLSLLSFIKNELSCRGRGVREWAGEFENDALRDVKFIDALRESGSLYTAFFAAKKNIKAENAEAMKVLDAYFSSFGSSYRSEEEGEACRVFEEISRILEKERSDSQRSVKVIRVLSYATALGAVILLL